MATMKDLANLLGLELYEEFKIKGSGGRYRITKETLEWTHAGIWEKSNPLIEELFNGTYELEPWKPKKNDVFYIVDIDGIESFIWKNDATDVALYKMGNCFKTEKDAEKHKEEILNKIKEY